MHYLILGSGGVGCHYGAQLLGAGKTVCFVARGAHLQALQKNGLHLQHNRESVFQGAVDARMLHDFSAEEILAFDVILLTAKATATAEIGAQLQQIIGRDNPPFIVTLQNGVENEEILCRYFASEKIIGGLCRKIGAHIVAPGVVESTGTVETIVGALVQDEANQQFLQQLQAEFTSAGIGCECSPDITLELWKKLIINNGVNAICALLQTDTGRLLADEKLAAIVYQLMQETARAAKAKAVQISQRDVDEMFALIRQFDAIKPSMLVDREQGRAPEIDQICGPVIRCLQAQGLDAPYTQSIAALLEFALRNENQ